MCRLVVKGRLSALGFRFENCASDLRPQTPRLQGVGHYRFISVLRLFPRRNGNAPRSSAVAGIPTQLTNPSPKWTRRKK